MRACETYKNVISDREGWRERIRTINPTYVRQKQKYKKLDQKTKHKLILTSDTIVS